MLFRAQDENFGDVCMFYAARLESKGGDPEMIRRVRAPSLAQRGRTRRSLILRRIAENVPYMIEV